MNRWRNKEIRWIGIIEQQENVYDYIPTTTEHQQEAATTNEYRLVPKLTACVATPRYAATAIDGGSDMRRHAWR